MMKKAIVLSVLFCFFFSLNASAKNVWEMAQSPVYKEKVGGMLGRGLLNVVSCPIDIPVSTVNGAKNTKPEFIGAIGGFATGAACTILRAASGIIDVATFWVPGFNGLPVSRNYGNCLQAETVVAPSSGYIPPTTVYQPTQTTTSSSSRSRMKYVKK